MFYIFLKEGERQAKANSEDTNQMLHSAASDQGLHCLPLFQNFLDESTGNKIDLFTFL